MHTLVTNQFRRSRAINPRGGDDHMATTSSGVVRVRVTVTLAVLPRALPGPCRPPCRPLCCPLLSGSRTGHFLKPIQR